MAYPELEPDQYPDVWARLRAAQEALDQHLRDHRDVLGTHPRAGSWPTKFSTWHRRPSTTSTGGSDADAAITAYLDAADVPRPGPDGSMPDPT